MAEIEKLGMKYRVALRYKLLHVKLENKGFLPCLFFDVLKMILQDSQGSKV